MYCICTHLYQTLLGFPWRSTWVEAPRVRLLRGQHLGDPRGGGTGTTLATWATCSWMLRLF
jgi:hypothetical protein